MNAPFAATAGPVCPRCQNVGATKPGFTWWGGVLGPKIIDHVKCNRCGHSFNPSTGKPITGAIVIYSVIVGVLALILIAALAH
ncbi:MAG TPA: hypothetical protein VLX92_25590 [Kofleriaceae bacterium]|nr:hypothetical protein [Kofleriaceae bacterium]